MLIVWLSLLSLCLYNNASKMFDCLCAKKIKQVKFLLHHGCVYTVIIQVNCVIVFVLRTLHKFSVCFVIFVYIQL